MMMVLPFNKSVCARIIGSGFIGLTTSTSNKTIVNAFHLPKRSIISSRSSSIGQRQQQQQRQQLVPSIENTCSFSTHCSVARSPFVVATRPSGSIRSTRTRTRTRMNMHRNMSTTTSSTSDSDATTLRLPLPHTMQHISYTPGCAAHELTVDVSSNTPIPELSSPEDVLIQVAYSGVGGTDLAQRRGMFNPKSGSPSHHLLMGLEVSGIVADVGTNVTDFKVGDYVVALLYGGGYAQYAVAPQQQVLELPSTFTLEEGAAIPENYWTVYANLFESEFGNLGENPSEKTLLVHGGTGGIGSTALQLSKALGVKQVITTVSSSYKQQEARETFGADLAIDYTTHDFVEEVKKATQGQGVDVILCFLGGDYTPRNIEALAKHGRLIQLGLRRGKEVTFDFKVLMNKWATITGGHLRPRTIAQKKTTRNALRTQVLPLWENGTLPKPTIMEVFPLQEAGKAHTVLEEGKVIGKVILKP
mmetsp:Transcript_2588/g.3001  ORF Transcript_2588/g.3001 Transcript_2588/m.3001 type:complete len:474 (+) Transcript_2588:31-1452(+)